MAAPLVFGLDVGGTKILSGLVDREGNVIAEGDRAAEELYGAAADAQLLIERARAGEEEACPALSRIGESLGAGIESLVNVFDPEVVVVGGGFGAAAGDRVLGPAREAARRDAVPPANRRLRIVQAELGAEAGLVGAGLVRFEALDGLR